jgi:L-ascorbate metabolism protein UlaG (beta-lactamase superfamily)
MDVTFLGHACFTLSDGNTTVLIDPFLSGNPKAAISADDVSVSTILLTHGHGDHDPNLGGTVKFDWGWVKLVPAWHTSTTPKGTVNTPAGLLINFMDTIVYHLGDTCLFSDLQLVGKRAPIDVALMCIGGHYTMDSTDAVDAAQLVGAKTVIPCHYDTFPLIETDAQAFKSAVESSARSSVVILDPGQSFQA